MTLPREFGYLPIRVLRDSVGRVVVFRHRVIAWEYTRNSVRSGARSNFTNSS
jgi:hypothetical protein